MEQILKATMRNRAMLIIRWQHFYLAEIYSIASLNAQAESSTLVQIYGIPYLLS